jgi:hypothetical protein
MKPGSAQDECVGYPHIAGINESILWSGTIIDLMSSSREGVQHSEGIGHDFSWIICLVDFNRIFFRSCSPTPEPEVLKSPTALPCAEEVTWNQAIEILNSGQVESIMQSHNLEISFVLEGGCRIWTIEPRIDDIFEEVRKCGELCAMIPLGTE